MHKALSKLDREAGQYAKTHPDHDFLEIQIGHDFAAYLVKKGRLRNVKQCAGAEEGLSHPCNSAADLIEIAEADRKLVRVRVALRGAPLPDMTPLCRGPWDCYGQKRWQRRAV